jgi:hypothetical protein
MALEGRIQEHLQLSTRQQGEARQRLQALEKDPEAEMDEDMQERVFEEIEKQSSLLEANQASCGVVLSQVQSRRRDQEISDIITSDDSKALIGMPESVVGKIQQRITGVRTVRGSSAIIGVYGHDVRF